MTPSKKKVTNIRSWWNDEVVGTEIYDKNAYKWFNIIWYIMKPSII